MWIFFLQFFFFLFVFLLYFTLFFFVNFFVNLLCCSLLFVYFYLLIYLFIFLPSWIFGGGCKFNCSWHFFTSSDRVPPGALVAQGPRFEDRYRRVVSYTNDDLGKRVGWMRRIDGYGTEETVDDGLGGRCLGAGRCPVAPSLWLVMAGLSGRWCQLLCLFFCFVFFIFWKSMEFAGKVLEWWKVPCSTVTRLELRGQGQHMLWNPHEGFSRCNT